MNIGSELTFLILEKHSLFFGHRSDFNTFGQFVLINQTQSAALLSGVIKWRGEVAEYPGLIFSLNHTFQLNSVSVPLINIFEKVLIDLYAAPSKYRFARPHTYTQYVCNSSALFNIQRLVESVALSQFETTNLTHKPDVLAQFSQGSSISAIILFMISTDT